MPHVEKYNHKNICVIASFKFDITTQKSITVSQYISPKDIDPVVRRSEGKWQNIKNYEGRNWKRSRSFTVIMLLYNSMVSPHQWILHETLVALSETYRETGKYTGNGDNILAKVRKSGCLLLRKKTVQKWWARYQLNHAWQGKVTKEWLFFHCSLPHKSRRAPTDIIMQSLTQKRNNLSQSG